MDFFLVGVLTVFALILGGILYWSQQGPTGKKGLPIQLDVAPETIVEMQLEEILEGKNEAAPDGKSFHFPLNERDNYTELKESTPDDKKALSSTLLKRCIECLNATMTYDARVKIVYESYNNMVPREILAFLNGIKTELTDEIEAIKTEANTLKEGWGENIFKQVSVSTVMLFRVQGQWIRPPMTSASYSNPSCFLFSQSLSLSLSGNGFDCRFAAS